jgi:dephospho-CoA kinase
LSFKKKKSNYIIKNNFINRSVKKSIKKIIKEII